MKLMVLFLILLLLSSCASVDTAAKRELVFSSYTELYPARPKDSPIELFSDSTPQQEYEVIGEISGSIDGDTKEMLQAKARQVGADGLIDIEISSETKNTPADLRVKMDTRPVMTTPVYTPGYSYTVYQVKAKAIRYKK
jgi:hypothetical protein